MAADNDWDLGAVVRSCRAAAAAKTLDRRDFASFPLSEAPLEVWEEAEGAKGGSFFGFSDLFQRSDSGQELEELCKPFLINRVCQRQRPGTGTVTDSPYSASAASVFAAAVAGPHQPPPPARQPHRSLVQMPRAKRRRNQQKKVVCHVSAARLSDDDVWAWRKYGQKPIKGSPYPRGYYRCSSSKGCLARKQVERSRADPATFIITYTAEHNHPVPTHRNSLAGSTRLKFPSPGSPTSVATAAKGGASSVIGFPPHSQNPINSPLYSSASDLSPTTPLTSSMEDKLLNRQQEVDDGDEADDEEVENEEEMLLVEDMEVMGEDELLFVGVAEGVAIRPEAEEAAAEFLSDEIGVGEHFLAPPWLSNTKNAATAAGGT